MLAIATKCCDLCGNPAKVMEVELTPKFVLFDEKEGKGYTVCRDCFEIAWKGAKPEDRYWNLDAQCAVFSHRAA